MTVEYEAGYYFKDVDFFDEYDGPGVGPYDSFDDAMEDAIDYYDIPSYLVSITRYEP